MGIPALHPNLHHNGRKNNKREALSPRGEQRSPKAAPRGWRSSFCEPKAGNKPMCKVHPPSQAVLTLTEAILGTSRGVSHECPPEKPHPNTSRTSLSLPASTEAHLSPGPAAQRETLVQLWSNSQELTQCSFSKPIDPKAHGGRSIWRAGKLQHVLGRLQASMLAAKDHFRRLFLCVI